VHVSSSHEKFWKIVKLDVDCLKLLKKARKQKEQGKTSDHQNLLKGKPFSSPV